MYSWLDFEQCRVASVLASYSASTRIKMSPCRKTWPFLFGGEILTSSAGVPNLLCYYLEMKSLYLDKEFAAYWNERAGNDGEIYKRLVLDPIMFDLVGPLKDKVVVELGCGNGYLSSKFLEQDPKQLTLLDISKYNLDFAKQKTKDSRVLFLEQDATFHWDVSTVSVDVVYSNMMLNEVENIETPIKESLRVLKEGGILVFSVTHPAWDLFVYAQEKTGLKSDKIKNLGNYFHHGFAKYIMGADSKTNPSLAEKYKKEFEVEHYQRMVSDYFNTLVNSGFTVLKIIEPMLTEELLKESPRFQSYQDHPIGLIFFCKKS